MVNKSKNKLTEYILKKSKNDDKKLKYDFMPSLLEIIERPAHIASKVIIISTAFILVIAIMWAYLSKIDVVVNAQGSITTNAETCIVSSETTGVVKKIYAQEGDLVQKGDVLLELDASEYNLDIKRLKDEMEFLKVEKEVISLYMNDTKATVDINAYDERYRYIVNELIYENKMYINQKEQSIYASESLDIQYMASLNERMRNIIETIKAYEYELNRKELLLNKMVIKAQTSGYILSSSVSYEGQVISTLSELYVIIPNETKNVFEGYILDKDISEVNIGDNVEIKLQSYNYSDYGSIKGKIEYISPSTFMKEGIGNVYIARITIDEGSMSKDIELTPGLTGVMEIHIGKRSVLNYFLEPILNGLDNSLKEK